MTACGHIDLDALARTLRPSRRPDVAAGVLLAAELLAELPGLDARIGWTALRDAAVALYEDAGDDLLAELLAYPDGEHVDEDRLVCDMCDGNPSYVIAALREEIDAVRAELRRTKEVAP